MFSDRQRSFCLRNSLFIGFLCALSCTAGQREGLKKTAFTALDCSLHSSLGCAGQAAGACEVPSVSSDGWGVYAECLSHTAQGCMTKSLARCALAGIAATVAGPIVGGGSGCGSDVHAERVQLCVAQQPISNQIEAVDAAAHCWREVCGF